MKQICSLLISYIHKSKIKVLKKILVERKSTSVCL